jgi:AcrR family transcriptional regulator
MKQGAKATRDRILDAGLDLLSTSGFAGVTLGVLADKVGMSKSGLFAHFSSKEEVELELLSRTFDIAANQVMSAAMRAPQGLPRLEAAVLGWFGWFVKAGFPGGCPVAAAMFELDDVDGPVRDKVLAHAKQWDETIRQLVIDAITTKHLRKNLDVDQFLWELHGIYLGHHVALRFFRDSDADSRAKKAFQRLIESALPIESRRSSKQTLATKRK